MRLLLMIFFLPLASQAQEDTKSHVSLYGGYENYEPNFNGWFTGLAYAADTKRHPRLRYEWAYTFGIAELNGDPESNEISPYSLANPSYIKIIHYKQLMRSRFAFGLSFAPVKTERHQVNVGINLVTDLIHYWKEHGEYVQQVFNPSDSTFYYSYTPYSEEAKEGDVPEPLGFYLQPNLDYCFSLNTKWKLFFRIGSMFSTVPVEWRAPGVQTSLGVRLSL